MRFANTCFFLAISLLHAAPIHAQATASSSPEDQQRFVSITQKLERAPLSRRLHEDRQWAIQWLSDAPDVPVATCLQPLAGAFDANYSHAAEVVIQYMFAIAAFIIQHPEKAGDSQAQQLAGVEGGLNAYRSILKADIAARSPRLDKLLQLQTRRELPAFVRKASVHCSAQSVEQLHRP